VIDYTPNLWPKLELFLYHTQVETDNNFIENDIRPTAVGKKNWLFGGDETGKRSAILNTLIESTPNPLRILKTYSNTYPSMTNPQLDNMLPENWQPSTTINVPVLTVG